MSHDIVTCPDCDEEYDEGGTPHVCPGTPQEQIDALQRELRRLRRSHEALLRLLVEYAEPDVVSRLTADLLRTLAEDDDADTA